MPRRRSESRRREDDFLFDDPELAKLFFNVDDRVRVRDKRESVPYWRYGVITGVVGIEGGGYGYEVKLDRLKNPVATDGVNFDIEKHAPRRPRKNWDDDVNHWKT